MLSVCFGAVANAANVHCGAFHGEKNAVVASAKAPGVYYCAVQWLDIPGSRYGEVSYGCEDPHCGWPIQFADI
jgi:hypothetical protein